ncbi:MAG TPA: HAD-IA family hydrolase [Candidatus Udaeobacter sp.]|nr:HAD-IA family hydrolase [Candidatus Udaeobacter sp.]
MKHSAVIFDFYGTLVDDFASSVGQTHGEFVKALPVLPESFREFWKQTTEMRVIGAFQTVEASIEYVCDLLGAVLTAEQLTRAVELRLQSIKRTLSPRANALETLARLKNDGYKIALLSNCSIEIPILWPETPFADLFDSTIFSSRERLKKPDPRIYQLACDRLGVIPENCLYIADGENYELTAAGRVGLHPVLIRNSAQDNSTELLREAREWQGDSIGNLTEVLQRGWD